MKEFEEHKEFRNPPSELFRDIACNVVDFYNLTQECCGSDKRIKYPQMATKEPVELDKLQEWADLILHHLDSFDEALHNAGFTVESNLATLSEKRIDFIAHRIEQKILETQ